MSGTPYLSLFLYLKTEDRTRYEGHDDTIDSRDKEEEASRNNGLSQWGGGGLLHDTG